MRPIGRFLFYLLLGIVLLFIYC